MKEKWVVNDDLKMVVCYSKKSGVIQTNSWVVNGLKITKIERLDVLGAGCRYCIYDTLVLLNE